MRKQMKRIENNDEYKDYPIEYIERPKKSKIKPILLLVMVLAIGGIGYTIGANNKVINNVTNNSTTKAEKPVEATVEKGNYEVVSLKMIDSGSWYDAECTLRNTSDKTVEYAEATIKFVDENGDTVFSDWANTMNIEPGDTWHFVIYGLENKDAVKCELGKVTGFN